MSLKEENASGAITEWDPVLLQKIVSLGFEEDDAKEALAATDGLGKNRQEQVWLVFTSGGCLLTWPFIDYACDRLALPQSAGRAASHPLRSPELRGDAH